MIEAPPPIAEEDRVKINIYEKYELRHWSRKFGVTEHELRETIRQVGPMVADVEAELNRR